MSRFFLALVVIVCLVGCKDRGSEYQAGLRTIRNCEYVVFVQRGGNMSVLHAGDCTNPLHYLSQQPAVIMGDNSGGGGFKPFNSKGDKK